jgi:hypothetical protein
VVSSYPVRATVLPPKRPDHGDFLHSVSWIANCLYFKKKKKMDFGGPFLGNSLFALELSRRRMEEPKSEAEKAAFPT